MDKPQNYNWPRICLVTCLLTVCLLVQAMMTRVLGIGLVCMTQNITWPSTDLGANGTTPPISRFQHRKLKWDYKIQSNIVAAHDWGELFFLPLAGYFIHNGNVANVLLVSFGSSVLSSLLFPVVTNRFDSWGAVGSRLWLGASRAFASPCIDASVAALIPFPLRNSMYSIVQSGNQVASIVINNFVAYFCQSGFLGLNGLEMGYFLSAFLGAVWLAAFLIFKKKLYEDDGEDAERKMRTKNLENGHSNIIRSDGRRQFLALLKSPALWSIVPCNFASIWTIRLLMFYVPSFYRDVFRMSLMQNGLYSSLPFLSLCFSKTLFSGLSTWIDFRFGHRLSRNTVSKFFNTVAFVGSGLVMLLCTRQDRLSEFQVIAYITIAGTLFSATSPGFRVSIVTLSKKYTAKVSSISITAQVLGAIILPYIAGSLIKKGTLAEWSEIFRIVAAMNFFAALIYLLFGSVNEIDVSPSSTSTSVTTRRKRSSVKSEKALLLENDNNSLGSGEDLAEIVRKT
uniref:Uncharacterized protein n=1 Tax=Romanomermis culicivorax TaxID=13658 RepID=A0A915JM42_ROMCU